MENHFYLISCVCTSSLRFKTQINKRSLWTWIKDTQPSDIIAAYDNMLAADNPKKEFTISNNDDVTNLSREKELQIRLFRKRNSCMQILGPGADGTGLALIRTNAKIIGDH